PRVLPTLCPPPRSALLPYTALFRSSRLRIGLEKNRSAVPSSKSRNRAPLMKLTIASSPSTVNTPRNWTITVGALRSTLPTELPRSEEHTSELQSREKLVCRLLLEKK